MPHDLDDQNKWSAFGAKMREKGCSEAAIAAFKSNFDQLLAGATGFLPESTIAPVESLPDLRSLPEVAPHAVKDLLAKTAMLKLNGGLGTSMGLEKAKSLLVVKDGKTFIDLIALQVKHMRASFDRKVLFILMNSFSTSEDTKAFLAKKHPDLLGEPYIELMQNSSPKVDVCTLQPASYPENPENEWCPPGHGDIYPSLLGSGMLEKLLGEGIEYLFVSNSDNLGATLDLTVLDYFASSGNAFLMEVCERTAADKKGGHLCKRLSDDKFTLRESAMCPESDKAAFEDIKLHKYFNTNNLWLHLPSLKTTMADNGGSLPMPLIKNRKTVNPRDSKSEPVYQLETAMGSAIECFSKSGALVVPRTRFAPVKTCGDLFILRSDVFKIAEDATIQAVTDKVPLVKLDDTHYKLVDQMEALVEASPSLIHATSLTVKGPIKFAAGVIIEGDVTLEAEAPKAGGHVVLKAGKYETGVHKVAAALEAATVPHA